MLMLEKRVGHARFSNELRAHYTRFGNISGVEKKEIKADLHRTHRSHAAFLHLLHHFAHCHTVSAEAFQRLLHHLIVLH